MKTDTMLLAELKLHPLQAAFYSDCSADDDKVLASDLRQRGQQDPIVVMPPGNAAGLPGGTILDGHRRARLMQDNGETQAIVVIRHDLKDADAATVEAEFLKYNFTRRQLHPLDKARIAQHLYALERGKTSAKSLWRSDLPGLRDRVGQVMNMSGRNLDRYVHVLKAPLPIQQAVRDGRLKLVLGAKIGMLPEITQKKIADAIAGVTDAKQVLEIVCKYVKVPDSRRHQDPDDAVRNFARVLDRALEDLDGRVDRVGAVFVRDSLDTFRRARDVLTILIKKAATKKDANPDRLLRSISEKLTSLKALKIALARPNTQAIRTPH